MQRTLFSEYFCEKLTQSEGILAAPLQITESLLFDDSSDDFLEGVKNDQKVVSEKRAQKRKRKLSGTGSGNTHMSAELVAFFCVARSFYPDIYGERGYKMLRESSSLNEFLALYETSKYPGRSTIHEQLSSLSEETLTSFWRCILNVASREDMDDFSALIMDSTAITADSAWPVDSLILSKQALRILSELQKTIQALPVTQQRQLPLLRLENHVKNIKKLDFEISCQKGKKNAKKVRDSLYKKLLESAEKVEQRVEQLLSKMDHLGVEVKRVMEFNEVCKNFYDKILTTQRRFGINLEDCGAYEPENVHSVADPDASFINKGGRETVFGYRPTFGQSINGFITSFTLEPGNTSDAKAFEKVLQNHYENCQVNPLFISTDDGYPSKKNLDLAIEQGAALVSFAGSKGKAILGEELYESESYKEARKLRSASEATISNLKNVRGLARFTVCGIKRIRQELIINIIGYNLERMAAILKKSVSLEKAA